MLIDKNFKLADLALFSGFLYVSFLAIEPMRRLFGGVGVTSQDDRFFWMMVLLLLVNFAIYIYTWQRAVFVEANFNKFFKYYVGLSFVLLFVWPATSNDIFSYIYQGRVWSIYHANPYLNSYSQFSQDIFYNTATNLWSGQTTVYGPLFVIVSGILTWLSANSLWGGVYLFKLLLVSAHVLSSYLFYKLTNFKTFFLYAFNPLIILEFVINGHNESLVILMLLVSIYYLRQTGQKNQLLAWFFLVVSALIKQMTVILWPILYVLLLKDNFKKRQITSFLLKSLPITILTISLAYAPFLKSWEVIYKPLVDHNILSGCYSLLVLPVRSVLLLLFQINAVSFSLFINRIAFAIFYAGSLFKIMVSRDFFVQFDFERYATWILAVFFLTCLTWCMPWYFTLLIVLSLLSWHNSQNKTYVYLNYFFTVYGIIYYVALR